MKQPIQFLCIAVLALLAGACASPGYKKGEAAAESLNAAARQVMAENQGIDLTLSRLRDLITQPTPDLRPQFKNYQAALRRLESIADKSDARAADMRKKYDVYFATWETNLNTISYEAVRNASEVRRQQVKQEFEAVERRYSEAHAAVGPLINYFRDIRAALEADLTRDGLESVRPIYHNAEDNAKRVQSALDKLSEELDAFRHRMSAVGAEPAPQPTSEPGS